MLCAHARNKQLIYWHIVIYAKHQVHKHCIGVFEQVPPPPPSQTSFSQFEKKKSFMTKGSRGVTGSLGPLRNEFFTQAVDSYYYRLKFGHECFLLSCSSPYRLVAHFFWCEQRHQLETSG